MMKLRRLIGASPPTPRRSAAPFLGFVLVAALALAGCGAESGAREGDEANASEAVAEGDPLLDFYQCLRDNGLDVPDPDSRGGIMLPGVDPNDPLHMEVIEDCAATHDLGAPGGGMAMRQGDARPPGPEDLQALNAFSECMRDNGVDDFPDPKPDGSYSMGDGFSMGQGGPTSEFRTAVEACQDLLDGAGMRMTR